MGSTTWMTKSYKYVDRYGTMFTTEEIKLCGQHSPFVALENGCLIHYIVLGPVKKIIYDYRFDRATGDIYVNQGKELDMRIVSVEPDRIVVQSSFGILDRGKEADGQPAATGETSYMLSELVPADEALMERIAEPDDIIDRRK